MKHVQDLLKATHGSAVPMLSAEELMLQAAEISRQAAERLADERRASKVRRVGEMLSRSAVPVRYRDAKLVAVRGEQMAAYALAERFVANFADRLKSGAGMVLHGPVGTGKTHLACAMANALAGQLRTVLYCTALELVTLVRSSWRRDAEGSEFEVYAGFAEPQLLIIDEIGVQSGSDFERMVLTAVVDLRSRACLPTVVISNLEPMPLLELLGDRLFDRLVGFGADVVHVPGRSLRAVANG